METPAFKTNVCFVIHFQDTFDGDHVNCLIIAETRVHTDMGAFSICLLLNE